MKKKYILIKEFSYEDMPKRIKTFFEKNYKWEASELSIFYVNSIKGKPKDHYTGKNIICKWTWGKEKTTYIIEREDDILFDWLIDNGLSIKDDDYALIKH